MFIIGRSLRLEATESRQPVIGSPTHLMSTGRWSCAYMHLNIGFVLDSLTLISKVPNFSIGCYGALTEWDTIDTSGCLNICIPDFKFDNEHYVPVTKKCYLPDKRSDSTKHSEDAVYFDENQLEAYKIQLDAKLNSSNSFSEEEYQRLSKMEKELMQYLAEFDLKAIKEMISAFKSLKEIGDFVIGVCKYLDLHREDTSNENSNKYKEIFSSLFNQELNIFGDGRYNKYPLYTLSIRAFYCVKDYLTASYQFLETESSTFGVFMDELNLTEEMHDLFFPGRPLRQYKPLARYYYSVNVWDDINNDLTDDLDECISVAEEACLFEKKKTAPMDLF